MSSTPLSPSGPGGLLHNYGINYNMLETILPNYGLIRRLLSRKVGVDISSVLGIAFIGFTLTETCTIVWRHAKGFAIGCASWVTSSITLQDNDILARNVAAWSAEHITNRNTRYLSAVSADNNAPLSEQEIYSSMYNSATFEPKQPSSTEPDKFDDVAWNLILMRHEQLHTEETSSRHRGMPRMSSSDTRLVLTCFGWSSSPLKKFLQQCKDFVDESAVSTTTIHRVWRPGGLIGWDRGITRPSRPLSTVDLDPMEKQGLVDDVSSYLGARQFYARRGIPYRRGYLFHGPPGTGKTSLASAIAGHFELDVYMMSLADPVMNDSRLDTLFMFLPQRCVIMLEDVDAIGITEDREKQKKKESQKEAASAKSKRSLGEGPKRPSDVTLSGLLNAIDGVSSKEGRILVMTTNVPEVLDKALIRPGRIDRQVFLGPLSKQNAKQIFLRMYTQDPEEVKQTAALANKQMTKAAPEGITMVPPVLSPVVRGPPPTPGTPLSPFILRSPRPVSSDGRYINGMDDLDLMATAFMNKIPDKILTPAEVQGFLLSHREDMMGALTQCDAWVADMLDAKQRKSNIIKLNPAPTPHNENKVPSKPLPLPKENKSVGAPVADEAPKDEEAIGVDNLDAIKEGTS